jgi:hypothetical protein
MGNLDTDLARTRSVYAWDRDRCDDDASDDTTRKLEATVCSLLRRVAQLESALAARDKWPAAAVPRQTAATETATGSTARDRSRSRQRGHATPCEGARMKLFGATREQTPVEAATATRDQAATKRARLSAQAMQAESELARVKEQAAAAALREAPLEVKEIAAVVAAAQSTHEALATALTAADTAVVAAEEQLVGAQDAEQRAASVAELSGLINHIESAGLPFKAALRDLVGLLNRGGEISHDAKAVAGLFGQLGLDADQLLNTATVALDHHAKQIGAGLGRATLSRPQPVRVAVAKPTTTSVLLQYASEWTDHLGAMQRAAAGFDIELQPAVAHKAIVSGIAISSDDARAAQKRAERLAINAYDPDRLVALDSANPQPPPAPLERLVNPHLTKWQMPSAGGPRPWISK